VGNRGFLKIKVILDSHSRVAENGHMAGPLGHCPMVQALALLFYGDPVHINGVTKTT
jgi:hypothetical protein